MTQPISMSDFVGNRQGAAKRLREQDVWRQTKDETDVMMRSGEWGVAEARHIVQLYATMHGQVYGVPALDLSGQGRFHAAQAATRLIRECFEDDVARMAAFVWWTWKREAGREQWRRQHRTSGYTLGHRQQFGEKLVGEYLIDMKRTGDR
jgi:hypothetical protein